MRFFSDTHGKSSSPNHKRTFQSGCVIGLISVNLNSLWYKGRRAIIKDGDEPIHSHTLLASKCKPATFNSFSSLRETN
jgi:hypothetical protein